MDIKDLVVKIEDEKKLFSKRSLVFHDAKNDVFVFFKAVPELSGEVLYIHGTVRLKGEQAKKRKEFPSFTLVKIEKEDEVFLVSRDFSVPDKMLAYLSEIYKEDTGEELNENSKEGIKSALNMCIQEVFKDLSFYLKPAKYLDMTAKSLDEFLDQTIEALKKLSHERRGIKP